MLFLYYDVQSTHLLIDLLFVYLMSTYVWLGIEPLGTIGMCVFISICMVSVRYVTALSMFSFVVMLHLIVKVLLSEALNSAPLACR